MSKIKIEFFLDDKDFQDEDGKIRNDTLVRYLFRRFGDVIVEDIRAGSCGGTLYQAENCIGSWEIAE